MALTVAGAHVAVGPLLSGCYSIVKGINQLHQSYKFIPLTLSSIATTCNMTSSTLEQVESTLKDYTGAWGNLYQNLLEQFDGIQIGCTMTLSLLETHVSDLLNIAASDVPSMAQKTARIDKLKALYNESDMKELFGQFKDYNALLNTVLHHLQSDKQDRMLEIMTNQEKTLESMLQAHNSLRRHLQAADKSSSVDSDAASILTVATNKSALAAFDFDPVIKATAVYKRCMKRRSDRTGLMSLGLSSLQLMPTSRVLAESEGPDEMSAQTSTNLESDHRARILHMAISPGLVLAVASPGRIRLWNLKTGKETANVHCKLFYTGSSVAFSPNGTLLAAVLADAEVSVWVLETGEQPRRVHIHNVHSRSTLAISANNEVIACCQDEEIIRGSSESKLVIYHMPTGKRVKKSLPLDVRPRMVSFIRNDSQILCCGSTRVDIWDVPTNSLTSVYEDLEARFTHSIVTDSLMLVCVNGLSEIVSFDLEAGAQKAPVKINLPGVYRLACSPGTEEIAYARFDGGIGTCNPTTGFIEEGPIDNITGRKHIAMSPNGQAIYYGGNDGKVKLWNWRI